VVNKVRRTVVPRDAASELSAALDRFAGRKPAALLPFDQDGLDSALLTGKMLAEVRPGSALRLASRELAAALAGVPSSSRRRRGGRSARSKR
jgi:MinD-like ATPase involved in chromosome partitioning or flagellar assembly